MYYCDCDCGNKNIVVYGGDLRSGHTQSCGCLRLDNLRQSKTNDRKYNEYDLTGDYGIGYTSKGEEFYFDIEDYDKIKNFLWYISEGYVVATSKDTEGNKKQIRIHDIIMQTLHGVDHKGGSSTKHDNRKNNLRTIGNSRSEFQMYNSRNACLHNNNTSGVSGVSWNKTKNKWVSYINVNKKRLWLGCFDDFYDAVKVRKEAEEKYYGEWSYDNSRKELINMIILVGKTASGKSTIYNELINMGMQGVISYTTRPIRTGEVNGIDYHFISEDEFLKLKRSGYFFETTSYNVATGETWYYGSAIQDLSNDKVMIVNPEGLKQIRKIDSLNPIAFYIMACEETIWNRLRQRGDNASEARRRLNADDEDFKDILEHVDFCLKNDLGLTPKVMAELIHYIYSKLEEK